MFDVVILCHEVGATGQRTVIILQKNPRLFLVLHLLEIIKVSSHARGLQAQGKTNATEVGVQFRIGKI